RRHTRSTRDWSSDVCSSDLGGGGQGLLSLDGRRVLNSLGDQRLCWRDVASRQLLTPTAAIGPAGGPLYPDGRTCPYVLPQRIQVLDFPRLLPAHVIGGVVGDSGFRAVAPPRLRFGSAIF